MEFRAPDVVVHLASIGNDYAVDFIDLVSFCFFAGDAVINNERDLFGVGNGIERVTVENVE